MANAEKNDIVIKFDVFLAKLQSLIFHFLFASSSKSRLLIFGLKFYLYKPNNWVFTDKFLPIGYPRVAGTVMFTLHLQYVFITMILPIKMSIILAKYSDLFSLQFSLSIQRKLNSSKFLYNMFHDFMFYLSSTKICLDNS